MTPEGKIKAGIKKTLKDKGVYCYSVNSSGLGSTGFPDLLLVVRGQLITIEVKSDEKRHPTLRQQYMMRRLREAGAITLLVHGGNIEALPEFLEAVTGGNFNTYPRGLVYEEALWPK